MNFADRHLVIPCEHAGIEVAGFAENDEDLARLGREGWEVMRFAPVPQPDAIGRFAAVSLLRRAADADAGGTFGRPETGIPRRNDPSLSSP